MLEGFFVSFRKSKIYSARKELFCTIKLAGLHQLMGAYETQRVALLTTQDILPAISTGK